MFRKHSAAFSSIQHGSIFLLHSCRGDSNGAPPWLDLEEEERRGRNAATQEKRAAQVAQCPPLHRQGRACTQAEPTGRAPPAQNSRFWELPEGNLRALHVCKGIWNKVIYGNIETWQPSREWWNAQLQIKSRSMIWSHYQTESLNSPGEFTKWWTSRIAKVLSFGQHENQQTSAIRTPLLTIICFNTNFLNKSS